jgi:wyosine [tRNA(Phe)-imidazoG37] synthetase (radical SAM superfamily)
MPSHDNPGPGREARRSPIIGGRVCTRTAARSLRVCLVPAGRRVCSFDCVYCTFARGGGGSEWPRPGDIGVAVANALYREPEVDSITISGGGEPTLHPAFGLALGNVLSARGGRSDLAVRIATNGATLQVPRMRRLLELADERIVRIDAGGERIARPSGRARPGAVLAGLAFASDFSVESVFVEGPAGNVDSGSVEEWLELLGELRPVRVYLTTIGSGRPQDPGVRAASPATLEAIARRLRECTSLPVQVIA